MLKARCSAATCAARILSAGILGSLDSVRTAARAVIGYAAAGDAIRRCAHKHNAVVDVMPDIRAALSSDGAYVFLEAPPGAGKTTTVPLAAAATVSEGLVVVVEPRRVAARAAAGAWRSPSETTSAGWSATRCAAMRGAPSGRGGLVVTDGVLLMCSKGSCALANVVIIFDEFHERGVNSDVALALCREAQAVLRPELRLCVMSATLLSGDEIRLQTARQS